MLRADPANVPSAATAASAQFPVTPSISWFTGELLKLKREGVPADIQKAYVEHSADVRQPTSDDLVELHRAAVDDSVIQAYIAAGSRRSSDAAATAARAPDPQPLTPAVQPSTAPALPAYAPPVVYAPTPAPVVISTPAPPPPPVVVSQPVYAYDYGYNYGYYPGPIVVRTGPYYCGPRFPVVRAGFGVGWHGGGVIQFGGVHGHGGRPGVIGGHPPGGGRHR